MVAALTSTLFAHIYFFSPLSIRLEQCLVALVAGQFIMIDGTYKLNDFNRARMSE